MLAKQRYTKILELLDKDGIVHTAELVKLMGCLLYTSVCLIHDYNNILVGPHNFLYLVQGHIEACGRIGVWAVSYTHLDVYKRQIRRLPA